MDDSQEQDMLSKLSAIARGYDPLRGQPVSQQEMIAAQQKYFEIKNMLEQRRLARDKLNADLSVEAGRVSAQRELEHRRLDIEEEKVKIQKAEVLVRALEVATQGGVDPNILMQSIQQLGTALLPGAGPLMLESREKK